MSGFVEAIAAVVGGVTGGVVSYFVSSAAIAQQSRDRAREKVEDLLADLAGAIHAYWGAEGKDAGLENAIVSGIHKCSQRLASIGIDARNDVEMRLALRNLNDIATGGQFQSVNRSPDGERARNATCALDALAKLIKNRRAK